MPEISHTIADGTQLRQRYTAVSDGALNKSIDHLDATAAAFIALSPLIIIATSDGETCDASPRGGPPGFVVLLDERRIAFGDLTGNNRLDSYSNLLVQPSVGMLFLVPGAKETMRVNGTASLRADLDIRIASAQSTQVPQVVVVVDISEVFLHCGAALRRSNLWETTTWPSVTSRPSAGQIYQAHLGLDVDPAAIDRDLEAYYEASLSEPGGEGFRTT